MGVPTLLTTPISKHFTYRDALWLPSWNRAATEADGLTEEILSNLITLFQKLDQVRDFFGMPIIVHVAYRPEAYNKLIGGALGSAHMIGKAVDFHVYGSTCDAAKIKINENNLLETLNLRMEHNPPGSGWVHLGNDWQEGHSRYFIP